MAFSPWLAQGAFLHHPGAPALAGTAPSRLGSSTSMLIKKIQYRPVQANLHFLSAESLFPNDSSLHQVDVKLTTAHRTPTSGTYFKIFYIYIFYFKRLYYSSCIWLILLFLVTRVVENGRVSFAVKS